MTAISLGWFEEEEPRDFVRWGTAAAIVLGIHAGGHRLLSRIASAGRDRR